MGLKAIISISILLFLSSCATQKAVTVNESLTPYDAVQGLWIGQCKPYNGVDSKRKQYLVASDRIQLSITLFYGSSCKTGRSLTIAFEGDISISPSDQLDGTSNIDIIYEPGTITASDAATSEIESKGTTVKAILKSIGYESLTNVPISDIGYSSYENFSIFKVNGNRLRVGATTKANDGTTPQTRPTELHKTAIYYKAII